MSSKTYIVTGSGGANLRELPSTTLGKVVVKLPTGAEIEVVDDIKGTNVVGSTTYYSCVRYNKRYLWCVSKLLTPKKEEVTDV